MEFRAQLSYLMGDDSLESLKKIQRYCTHSNKVLDIGVVDIISPLEEIRSLGGIKYVISENTYLYFPKNQAIYGLYIALFVTYHYTNNNYLHLNNLPINDITVVDVSLRDQNIAYIPNTDTLSAPQGLIFYLIDDNYPEDFALARTVDANRLRTPQKITPPNTP